MSEHVRLTSHAGGVRQLTIARPQVRNALDAQAFGEIIAACQRVAADDRARVLVLAGEGQAFSAGGDFETLQKILEAGREVAVAELRHANEGVLALASLSIPTVALVHGDAFGGGAAVALATDFRVMSAKARLGFVSARVGLSGADTGVTWTLSRLVGPARAFEILSLGQIFSADEARDSGLVTSVVPAERFREEAQSFVARVAALAPLAVGGTKRAMQGIEGRSFAAQLDIEAELQAEALTSQDFREGLAAFREKRSPNFGGR